MARPNKSNRRIDLNPSNLERIDGLNKELTVLGKKLTRRQAISTGGKVAIGVGAAIVIGGGAYAAYVTSQPAPASTTTSTSQPSSSSSSSSTSSSMSETSSMSSSSSTATSATGQPMKIGVAYSQTGFDSDADADIIPAKDVWAKNVNAAGGLLGRPVSFDYYDDGSQEATDAIDYTKMITQDNVDLIMGPIGTDQSYGAMQSTEKAGWPTLITVSLSQQLAQGGYKNYFGLWPTGDLVYQNTPLNFFSIMQKYANPMPKKIAIPTFNYQYSLGVLDAVQKYWAPKLGMEVVVSDVYNDPNIDFTPIIQKCINAEADIFMANGLILDNTAEVKVMTQLGYKPQAVWSPVTPFFSAYYQGLPATSVNGTLIAVGVWAPVPPWTSNADTNTFIKQYEAANPSLVPNYASASSYSGYQILQKAVEATGQTMATSAGRDAIRTFLHGNNNGAGFDTLLGNIKFAPSGQAAFNLYEMQWQNGKLEVVWPESVATAPPIWPKPWDQTGTPNM